MKKRILILVVSFFMLSMIKAQNKIGYVNIDKIFTDLPETKKADTVLAAYQESLAKAYQQQQNDLNDLYAKFVKDSVSLTPSAKEARRKEIQNSITQLQKKEVELNTQLQAKKDNLFKAIQDKIQLAIKDMAKNNGFAHIIYTNNALVLNADDEITEKIITKLTSK